MRFVQSIIFICLPLFFIEGYCQVDKDAWTSMDQSDFALSHPAGWSLDQSGQAGTKFILFTGQSNSGFRDNVNLIIQDLKGSGFDLDKYVTLSEGQVKTLITNSQIIESKRVKSELGEFQEVIFTGDQGVFNLKWRQRYWLKGEKAFVLTFTASQATYDQYKQISQKLFDSFHVK
jgi:hypothetical protein